MQQQMNTNLDSTNTWYETLGELNGWMTKNGRRPSLKSEDPVEERLGHWERDQIVNCNFKNDPKKKRARVAHITAFPQYYASDRWYRTLGKLNAWMTQNGRRPLSMSKDPVENSLGRWLSIQNGTYERYRRSIDDPEKSQAWEEHLAKFSECYNDTDQWYTTLNELDEWIGENGKQPSTTCIDSVEARLGLWRQEQHVDYERSAGAFQDPEKKRAWMEHIICYERQSPQEECVAPKEGLITAEEARQRSDDYQNQQLWVVDEQIINQVITDACSKGVQSINIRLGVLKSDMNFVVSKLKSAGFNVSLGVNFTVISW